MLATRVDRLEATVRAPGALREALRLLSDDDLERLIEFCTYWDGDEAHVAAVYAAWPGTREAVEALEHGHTT